MNTLVDTSAVPFAVDARVDATGDLYAFAFFYLGYAYFYFYLLTAGGT